MSANAIRTFWTAGDLRCVLVPLRGPQRYGVQVVQGTDVLCSVCIDGPVEIEGPAAAARLKVIFVDRAT